MSLPRRSRPERERLLLSGLWTHAHPRVCPCLQTLVLSRVNYCTQSPSTGEMNGSMSNRTDVRPPFAFQLPSLSLSLSFFFRLRHLNDPRRVWVLTEELTDQTSHWKWTFFSSFKSHCQVTRIWMSEIARAKESNWTGQDGSCFTFWPGPFGDTEKGPVRLCTFLFGSQRSVLFYFVLERASNWNSMFKVMYTFD